MKPIYVLIDTTTGDFYKPKRGYYSQPKRKIHAYTSEAKARAALEYAPNKNEIQIVEYAKRIDTGTATS